MTFTDEQKNILTRDVERLTKQRKRLMEENQDLHVQLRQYRREIKELKTRLNDQD
jgi:regulator of replication initiation timing